GLDLVLDGALSVPSGNESSLAGDGGLGGALGVTAGLPLGDVRVLANVGVRFRPSREIIRVAVGNELVLRGAVVYTLPADSSFVRDIIGELDAGTLLSAPFQSGSPAP